MSSYEYDVGDIGCNSSIPCPLPHSIYRQVVAHRISQLIDDNLLLLHELYHMPLFDIHGKLLYDGFRDVHFEAPLNPCVVEFSN